MPSVQKLSCVVEQVRGHGDRVYTVTLRPERPAPRFQPGQFLHLALDPYEPSGFWPESRVFSIASSPAERRSVRITYAVHGRFTERMESELTEGRSAWIKMPYGDFVVDGRADAVLFAGGTGVTAFTAFLEALPSDCPHQVMLAYGARTSDLLIYRDLVERCVARVPSAEVCYFVEGATGAASGACPGRVSVDVVWPRLKRPQDTQYYIAGPPAMLRAIGDDLHRRNISSEAIHIDAWE